ncbi:MULTISPECIES: aminomethyl-transferring glycine dehydrogenase subunit GcvPB [unclassified Lentimonas]|uniref:aminomethyl-transferring glycine dehydrogenase subunit GcvPB n=2 Tax=Lentimonas TaxID=417293 RepID=UPI001326AAC9|nr:MULTISPECIES: aminomethyl-transferring glycine dehydrogenase subunit GcvPB [unclassified Lentimonas]CAA6676745.1 Glycine dehydrogenase [decarboxylating] (glycine cleavage system P protein) (EC [Lentimonas sp. CC4]CAA6684590.1 Glycine dehydrogenase [decarboxylating] (glycine cleavage system P protein) (EC [Lentimonas sp. CC6]CAA7075226.1 Glycine dehydrogenase [decarboxylating] (glycine cleavage system P protein) (EC [Lentimonas sp. CC4]CAA7170611.1 Glycine dehydrogenase [decarboxylating] (gly
MQNTSVDQREQARHYIPASDADIDAMLKTVGKASLSELFDHIPADVQFQDGGALPDELAYDELYTRLEAISKMNRTGTSFLGDGVPDFVPSPVVGPVCDIRNLTTAYTPYQPELSQGTLLAHWIYQCSMARLTGFEAVNASLYDRSTSIFEGICAAIRMGRGKSIALIPETLYPGDLEVLETLSEDTEVELVRVPVDTVSGLIDFAALKAAAETAGTRLAAIVFPHVNTFGLVEAVDTLTDFAAELKAKSVAVIDPMLLGPGGLKAPSEFGANGADIIVGEAQHLALAPNFGGPGLGLFGVRFSDKDRGGVRAAPGRFIGKAKDCSGRDCRVGVLSTREQHIRKDKATSNICSNQAFVATLVGASLLERGDSGLETILAGLRARLAEAVECLTVFDGVSLAFPDPVSFHEVTFELSVPVADVLAKARESGILAGADVSDRVAGGRQLLKLSFSNREQAITELVAVFEAIFGAVGDAEPAKLSPVGNHDLRQVAPGLPTYTADEVIAYYKRLGDLNVSPDDGCYPLGSCTMKYNPKVNDWAASLPGFTDIHPQAPVEDAQGCLYVLHETQEWFKKITGLAAVTTQPLAGAQGELVGLKLFQAYHRDRGEVRDVILIPRSAHGTNFATATMAGFAGKKGKIVYLDADTEGRVLNDHLDRCIEEYGNRIAGVMITNPNTSGIFETSFKQIAEKIHAIGGLVYMDGANMNAIAGWIDLGALGVDAVHNNLHKTWTIPHGGGGPGDAIVAVSDRLTPYLPGYQIEFDGELYQPVRAPKSIGSFHRHWGNFAHKIRCYTYLLRLGREGVRRMSAVAVLSARYLQSQLTSDYALLPNGADSEPRMHEFILTLKPEDFGILDSVGLRKTDAAPRIGKLFLDFGFHAPTVAWPEPLGLMVEPTESYTKAELDRFAEAVQAIIKLAKEHPDVLNSAPHFTPIDRVEEVEANRDVCLSESLESLPEINPARVSTKELAKLTVPEIYAKVVAQL